MSTYESERVCPMCERPSREKLLPVKPGLIPLCAECRTIIRAMRKARKAGAGVSAIRRAFRQAFFDAGTEQ